LRGRKKECWIDLYKILEQNKDSDSKVILYYKNEILPRIWQDLQNMELEVKIEQFQLKYFPDKLLKYMPARFFVSASQSTALGSNFTISSLKSINGDDSKIQN
jgi:hypothetical protein